jgi:predicted nucleic acid-binding protein
VILVDTSAWVDFFRNERLATSVDEALGEGLVAVCGPVITELRRGLSARTRGKVLALLDGCTLLEEPEDLWVHAGDLGFSLARRGVSAKSLDLLIAVYAMSHDVFLLTADRDFRAMAKAGVPLRFVSA